MRTLKDLFIAKYLSKWVTRDTWGNKNYFCVGESKECIYLWCGHPSNGLSDGSNIHEYHKLDSFKNGVPMEGEIYINWAYVNSFDFYDNGDEIRWIK